MGKAEQVIRDRYIFDDGAIMEMVIWQVPESVPASDHDFKYRLFYGISGKRLVGYDNERGKGDHRHIEGVEEPYPFTTIQQLLADFRADVERLRGESI
ncbi:MAG: hypothetical protein GY862_16840 [Gammaproteobacteria bacterium]|nr:hypothetical protein [Gammaproteobacteria bacterium]